MIGGHNYFIYILTNARKTVLYIGVTNDLVARLRQHIAGQSKSAFTHKYNVKFLVYYERHPDINQAISREKQLKGWTRAKKLRLIATMNKEFLFLNDQVLEMF